MDSHSPSIRIIGMAPNTWHGQWVNRQQLLSRLGARYPVLYSTGAMSVWDRVSPAWRAATLFGDVVRDDNVMIEVAPKLLLRWPRHASYDQWVQALHAKRLRRLARPAASSLVAMIFHPSFAGYARWLGADLVVYHAYDLFEGTPGWNAEQDAMEIDLLRRADIVSTVSPAVQERLTSKLARDIRLLPNGVDLKAFAPTGSPVQEPSDLAKIPRPRLGYVGSLHPQVDYGLVAQIAKTRPDWHIVLVGGSPTLKDPVAEEELGLCRTLRNVHFLGEKSKDDVPSYMTHMDVNLMVYRLSADTWIRAIYPLKLHEYLAVERPVISVDIPSVREFSSVVRIAAGLSDWLSAIEHALEHGGTGTPTERRAVAAANTWDSRVQTLEGWIVQALAASRRA